MSDDDEKVRERAFMLWEQAGRPEGRSLQFWFEAIRELEDAAATRLPSQQVVEQGVLDADPESLAFRSDEGPKPN
jgi:hypothetical protein